MRMYRISKNPCFLQLLLGFVILSNIGTLQGQWTQLPNGPWNTKTFSLCSIGDTVYTSSLAGAFRLTDLGKSWASIGLGFPYGGSSPDQVAALGTDLLAVNNNVLFISTDAGISWSAELSSCRRIFVIGNRVIAYTYNGLMHSSDSGQSWKTIDTTGIGLHYILDFATIGGTIFASAPSPGSINSSTLYLTSDSGSSWIIQNVGLDRNLGFFSLAVVGSYLFTGSDSGIFRSSNNGVTWEGVGFPGLGILSLGSDSGSLFACVSRAVTRLSEVYRSDDLGATWSRAESGLPLPSEINVYKFHVVGNNLFAATDSGVYYTSDNGVAWHSTNLGLGILGANALCVAQNQLFVSENTTRGVWLTPDAGSTWVNADPNNGLGGVGSFASLGSTIFASTFQRGLYTATLQGKFWTSVELPVGNRVGFTTSIGESIYASGAGICFSTDTGKNWNLISSQDFGAYALAKIGPLLFSGASEGVYRYAGSTDWVSLSRGLNTQTVDSFVTQLAANGSYLYTTPLDINPEVPTTVFRSSDSGATWEDFSTGLPGTQINCLQSIGGSIFVSADSELLYSKDNGVHWESAGIFSSPILSLTHMGNDLLVGTKFTWIWRRPLSDFLSVRSAALNPSGLEVHPNYPNPFSYRTNLSITNSHRQLFVDVRITDILGQECAQIFSGTLDAGDHSFEWNASLVPDGVYFCVVRSESGVVEMPLVVRH